MESRRLKRKQERLEKKKKKNIFYHKTKRHVNINETWSNVDETVPIDQVKVDKEAILKEKKRKKEKEARRKAKKEHERQLIEQEERTIRQCERMLRLKTYTKRNKIPKSFYNEGLGELIEVCDNKDYEKYKNEYELEMGRKNIKVKDDIKSHQSFDEEDALELNSDSDKEQREQEAFNDDVDDDGYDIGDDSEDYDDDGDDDDEDNDNNEDYDMSETESDVGNKSNYEEEKSNIRSSSKPRNVACVKENGFYEDIYGFLHDSEGNIVKEENKIMKIEKKDNLEKVELDEKLQRRLRGQLNRLTASNIKVISNEITEMYRTNSRFMVNKIIFNFIEKIALNIECMVPCKIVSELSILIALLYMDIGDEIGGFFIHSATIYFDQAFNDLPKCQESKKLRNIVILILNFHATGFLDSKLLFDIIDKLCDKIQENETCIELIDMILKSNGFILRKDDPSRMKQLILTVQKVLTNFDTNALKESRIKYILESLAAIKNNNVAKLKMNNPVVMNELIENTLKGIIKKNRVMCISGPYSAVIQSSHWFSYTKDIVPLDSIGIVHEAQTKDKIVQSNESNVDLELHNRLCRALHLNTPLRRDLFMVLLKCNDYLDAACKLINIGKKQFAEVINLIIHVAINEKSYNPFYIHLLQHLTTCDRKYKIALNYSIRDKMVLIENMSNKNRTNFEMIIFNLMKGNALPITCLKVIEFSDMNETYVHFIRNILQMVFNEDNDVIESILSKIDKKDNFSKAIKLFINCFMGSDLGKRMDSIRHLQYKHIIM